MQLIMDTEPTLDLKDQMSTFQNSLDTNLIDTIDDLKNEMSNGNKENIESPKNVIEDAVNCEDLKCTNDSSNTIELAIKDDDVKGDTENKTDVEICEQDCEVSNCNDTHATNGVETINEDNEDLKKDNTLDNDIDKKEDDVLQEDTYIRDDTDREEDKIDQELSVVLGEVNRKNDEVDNIEKQEDDSIQKENEEEESNKQNIVEDNIKTSDVKEINLEETNVEIENKEEDIFDEAFNVEDDNIKIDSLEDNFQEQDFNLNDENSEDQILENKVVQVEGSQEDKSAHIANNEENTNKDTIENNKVDTNKDTMDIDKSDTDCLNCDLKEDNFEEEIKESKTPVEINSNTDENNENDDVELMDTAVEEIEDEKIVPIEKETLDTKANENNTISSDFVILDTDLEECTENNTITEASEILETETKVREKTLIVANDVDSEENKETDGSQKSDKIQVGPKEKIIQKLEIDPETKDNDDVVDCDVVGESQPVHEVPQNEEEIFDLDDFIKDTDDVAKDSKEEQQVLEVKQPAKTVETKKAPVCKLSNTLDILSDDDEETPQTDKPPQFSSTAPVTKSVDEQCIKIMEDDDDIMLIDEDTNSKDGKNEPVQPMETEQEKDEPVEQCTIDLEKNVENVEHEKIDPALPDAQKDSPVSEPEPDLTTQEATSINKQEEQPKIEKEVKKPLVAENFLKGYKKNLAEMTRDELEELCILKIVEGIVDRSNLSEIKTKLKSMAENIDEYKKKAMMLTKQNRDLQLVLKSVQEEQKKKSDTAIVPLKITRSVGMQVLMTDKPITRKKNLVNSPGSINSMNNKPANIRTPNPGPRPQKAAANNQQIPVPRLVPAATNPAVKLPNTMAQANTNNSPKAVMQALNGVKVTSPVQKTAEKRTHTRAHSVTVDLTDDEPPAKITPRSSPAPPVRLVSPQNLLARPQYTQALNSPRKVYIPISGPQGQNIRPGQTIMIKSAGPGHRMRGPSSAIARMSQNQVRPPRMQNNRHPAPLPEGVKQYQPANWKALPPAPDLKLSKVDNGIVISWKIEGYLENSYEEIASYQLYAYQETSSPPSTNLWKKIGDVKALPLPMACTLTQFMAGFKYYFAVRAVDVRSRLGPFSLPGSILLLNKM